RGPPVEIPRVLHVLAQLADAVHHAHERGVVHRDLKPENLLLVEHRGKPDVLKVLDFGIAKIVAPDYAESVALTEHGEIFGTPEYMSPERCTGAPAAPSSDLYAVGCIAFELLAGRPPFEGRALQLMHAHLTEEPEAPSRARAGVPLELDAIVLRLLAKK